MWMVASKLLLPRRNLPLRLKNNKAQKGCCRGISQFHPLNSPTAWTSIIRIFLFSVCMWHCITRLFSVRDIALWIKSPQLSNTAEICQAGEAAQATQSAQSWKGWAEFHPKTVLSWRGFHCVWFLPKWSCRQHVCESYRRHTAGSALVFQWHWVPLNLQHIKPGCWCCWCWRSRVALSHRRTAAAQGKMV